VAAAATFAASAQPAPAPREWSECVILQALDGGDPFVSDAAECAVKTAPASTFKVPHSLIALDTASLPTRSTS
jgi:beta-lactamase class D